MNEMIKKKLKLWRWKIKFLMRVPTMIFHRAYVEMTSGVLLGAFAGLSLGAARAGIISSRTTAVRSVSRVLTGWYMAGLSRVTAKSDRCEFVLSILTTTNLATRRISSHFISIEKPTHNSISSTPSDLQPAELTSTPPASPWHNLCNFLSSPSFAIEHGKHTEKA